jgi:hypothetical protein
MNKTRTRSIRPATLDKTARRRKVTRAGNVRQVTTLDYFDVPGETCGYRICRETVTVNGRVAVTGKVYSRTQVQWHLSYGVRLFPGHNLHDVIAFMRGLGLIAGQVTQ